MAIKIAIIGGGSAYAPGLLHAFTRHADDFSGAELALMDIAAAQLDIVYRLGCRMVEEVGADLRLTATTDRLTALTDADYVLTSFRQGGFEARHQDESIPLKHGIIGQETIGPGGFFFALRTLPVIQAITEEMRRLAPRAILVNYTNPTQIVAEAVNHFTRIPVISICDQSNGDLKNILAALNLKEPDEVKFESVGLNHATWSTRFQVNGQDGVALMLAACANVLDRPDISNRVKRQFHLTREFGRVPNSYLQYYYYHEETLAEACAAPRTRAQEIIATLPDYFAHYRAQTAAKTPRLKKVRGGSLFGDMAVEVLRSLVTDDGAIHTLNVLNRGALPGFDSERVVEVPCRLDRLGATPLAQPHLPHEVMGLLTMLAEYQWLAARAIWQGTRRDIIKALAANPLVLSLSLAETLLDEIIPLQRDYISERVQVS
jgi:6-phospho-beta-glucosidase